MLCYQDMTFYDEKKYADFKNCHRVLTETVKAKARKENMPISRYFGKPECYVDKTTDRRKVNADNVSEKL